MALSLSPKQFKKTIHTPSLSSISLAPQLQAYSTPRQFTEAEVVHGSTDHETVKLSMSQADPSLLSSNFGHVIHDKEMDKTALPSQLVPDLPSWTPLRTLGNNPGSSVSDSEPEVDELSINKATALAMKRLGEPQNNAQATAKNIMTAGQTLRSSSEAKTFKGKKARFGGVLITAKSSLHYKQHRSQTQTQTESSLVDALARTFKANRHTEGPFPGRSRTASYHHDDASTPPQTDVETTTADSAEDKQLRLNTRLAHTSSKRRHAQVRIPNASGTNSEEVTPFVQDIPLPERPVKRLKPIQYDLNTALIDAALGTMQAPISWDVELDIIIKGGDFTRPTHTAHVASTDVQMAVDRGGNNAGSPGGGSVPSLTPVRNEWRMPTGREPERTVLTPYLSRRAMFKQRLDAMFGENATVRTDRVARPRPADLDFFTPLSEYDREPTPNVSNSTVSVSPASTTEEGASAIPSTHITSQSSDNLPANTSMGQLSRNPLNEVDPLTKPTFEVGGEQTNSWITALQRLVKGKVHVKEKDLETLSIILAEVESVKDSLDEGVPMMSELRESVKHLSKLHEIPFGDRNKLRQRAENLLRTWPSGSQELPDVRVR